MLFHHPALPLLTLACPARRDDTALCRLRALMLNRISIEKSSVLVMHRLSFYRSLSITFHSREITFQCTKVVISPGDRL